MTTRRYADILTRVRASSDRIRGIRCETVGVTTRHSSPYEIVRVTVGSSSPRICLAAGIHGDEPAGVEALVRFLENLAARGGRHPSGFDFRIFPCNNPSGYERGTRENAAGIDLNRKFGAKNPPEEVVMVEVALAGETFDLFVDFHEDTDGEGFYLYEVLRKEGMAYFPMGRKLVEILSDRWPVDQRPSIDGNPNDQGLIRPEGTPEEIREKLHGLPLPLYLYMHGVGHSMTLETPTAMPFEDRVQMHLDGLEAILALIA